MATLVFPSHTRCPPYAQLFDEAQWSSLATMFLQVLQGLTTRGCTRMVASTW